MRDSLKLAGLSVYQKIGQDTIERPQSLGTKCPESSYREQGRKRKDRFPPSEYTGKTALGILDESLPFSLFIWFEGVAEEECCIVDLLINGSKSPGWFLKAGRKNGICVSEILQKGSRTSLKFQDTPANGVIQATFWKVMKMGSEFFPDEGEKAIAILQMHYRSQASIQRKVALHHRVLNSELSVASTQLSSPVMDKSRLFKFADRLVSDRLSSDFLGSDGIADLENIPTQAKDKCIRREEGASDIDEDCVLDQSYIELDIPQAEVTSMAPASLGHNTNTKGKPAAKRYEKTRFRRRVPLKLDSESGSLVLRITMSRSNTVKGLGDYIQELIKARLPESLHTLTCVRDGRVAEWSEITDETFFDIDRIVACVTEAK